MGGNSAVRSSNGGRRDVGVVVAAAAARVALREESYIHNFGGEI